MESIRTLPGIGPVKEKAYEKLGVETAEDLLLHFPRGYEDRDNIVLLRESANAASDREAPRAALLLTVATEPRAVLIRRGMTLLKFRAFDESGSAEITYFNQNYLKTAFEVGKEYRFYGRVAHPTAKSGRYLLTSPAFEPYSEEAPPPPFFPVYHLSDGLSQKQLQKDIMFALERLLPSLPDPLPEEIRRKYRLAALPTALRNIHRPEDYAALAAAKRRLIFDEFFLFALAAALAAPPEEEHIAPPCIGADLERFRAALPYPLTGAQNRAISEIRADMATDVPMHRILVGDVGSGKTVCAAAAAYLALASGRQAAIMAPTEILARQHYAELSPLFAHFGFETALLVGSTAQKEKNRIKAGLLSPNREERIDLVIGTHALLTSDVAFSSPGAVITDEQHRFGVEQREILKEKCKGAHLLVMSATPIPRSLALVLYGGLDLSKLDEMPAGRQKVDTFAVDESYRPRLHAFIRKQIALGGRVYAVCPAIEETEPISEEESADFDLSAVLESDAEIGERASPKHISPLKSVLSYCEELKAALPEIEIACLHGKMKQKEKEKVMQSFVSGETKVLVSTTVIEVGVNVPEATLMLVENAERFGLSQLHQLRGRVGRGSMKSYCVLVSDAMQPKAEADPGKEKMRSRLMTLCQTNDGFEIAEKDLETRGPGDFLRANGSDTFRQSGGLRFRLADLCTDSALFFAAMEEAKHLVEGDPTLASCPTLRTAALSRFSPKTAGRS